MKNKDIFSLFSFPEHWVAQIICVFLSYIRGNKDFIFFLFFQKHPAEHSICVASPLLRGSKDLISTFSFSKHPADQQVYVTYIPYRQSNMGAEWKLPAHRFDRTQMRTCIYAYMVKYMYIKYSCVQTKHVCMHMCKQTEFNVKQVYAYYRYMFTCLTPMMICIYSRFSQIGEATSSLLQLR